MRKFSEIGVLIIFSIWLVGCSLPPPGRSSDQEWVTLSALVDGVIEVQATFPYPANDHWTTKTQFAKSEANKLTRIFSLSYDPGGGRMDGMMWVHMYGAIFRLERQTVGDGPLTIGDVFEAVYQSDTKTKDDYKLAGIENIANKEWFRVNYKGDFPSGGVFYYKPIADKYALMISMEMFGEDSNRTKLYQQRYQDLLKAIGSVRIDIADFADKGN